MARLTGGNVGSVSITITGDPTGFRESVDKEVAKLKPTVNLYAKFNKAQLESEIKRVQAFRLAKLNVAISISKAAVNKAIQERNSDPALQSKLNVRVSVSAKQLKLELDKAKKKAQASEKPIVLDVTAKGLAKANAGLKILNQELKEAARDANKFTASMLAAEAATKGLARSAQAEFAKATVALKSFEVFTKRTQEEIGRSFLIASQSIRDEARLGALSLGKFANDARVASTRIIGDFERIKIAKARLQKPIFLKVITNIDQIVRQFGGFEHFIGRVMRSAGLAVLGFTAIITGAFLIGVTAAVRSFAALEVSARNAGTIFAELEPGVRRFGKASQFAANVTKVTGQAIDAARKQSFKSTFAAKDLADGLFFLASAGVRAKDAIGQLGTISRFAQAGMFDVSKASELLLQSANATGVGIGKLGRISDLLTEANIRSQSTVEDLAIALTNKAGAAFRLAKQPLQETIGLLQELGNVGITGRRAGEGLAISIREVVKAASGAKDTNKLTPSLEFKRLGINVFDAQGRVKSFSNVVDQLAGKIGGLSAKQQALEFKELGLTEKSNQVIRALIVRSLQLKKTGGSLKQQVDILNRTATGSTARLAKEQLSTLSARFALFKNQVVGLAQIFAGPIAKALGSFLGSLGSNGRLFDSLQKKAKSLGNELAKQLIPFLNKLKGDPGKAFFKGLINAFRLTLRGVKDFFVGFSQGFNKGKDSQKDFLTTFGELLRGFGFFVATIGPQVGKILGQIARFVDDNHQAIGRAAKDAIKFYLALKLLRIAVLPIIRLGIAIGNVTKGLAAGEGLFAGLARLGRLAGPIGAVVAVVASVLPVLIKLHRESESFNKFLGVIGKVAKSLFEGLAREIELALRPISILTQSFENFFLLLDNGDGIVKAFFKTFALAALEFVRFAADVGIKIPQLLLGPLAAHGPIKKLLEKGKKTVDSALTGLEDKFRASSLGLGASVGDGFKKGVDKSVGQITTQQKRMQTAFKTFFDIRKNLLRRNTSETSSVAPLERERIAKNAVFSGFDPATANQAVQRVIDINRKLHGISPVIKVTTSEINGALSQLGIQSPNQKRAELALGRFGTQRALTEGLTRLRNYRLGITTEAGQLKLVAIPLAGALDTASNAAQTHGKKFSNTIRGLKNTLTPIFEGIKGAFSKVVSVFSQTALEKRLRGATESARKVAAALASGLKSFRRIIRQPFTASVQDAINIIATLPARLNARIGPIESGLHLSGLALATSITQGFKQGFKLSLAPFAESLPRRIKSRIGDITTAMEPVGVAIISGLMIGMRSQLVKKSDLYNLLHIEIPEFIKKYKGPLAYDATILQPAGHAIMGGLTRGLRAGFAPVKSFLRTVGPSLEEFFPESVFGDRVGKYLIEGISGTGGGFDDPFKFFADLVPKISTGSEDFLGANPFVGFEKMFGLHRSSGDHDAPGVHVPGSYHYREAPWGGVQAYDYGDAINSVSTLLKAAGYAQSHASLFKEEFYDKSGSYVKNGSVVGGKIGGHGDHLHIAFALSAAIKKAVAGGGGLFGNIFAEASSLFHIPAALLKAVTQAESSFDPNAGSPAGARGLMQLLPATFAAQHVGGNILDPKQNIFAGAKYLKHQLDTFHTLPLALAAYNAGPGAATHAVNSFPETIAYIKRVLGFLKDFGGFRAEGGGVMRGRGYVVNERGPEAFVPHRPGFIMSNDRIDKMLRMMQATIDGGGRGAAPIVNNVHSNSVDPSVVAGLVASHQRAALAGYRA